LGSTPSATAQSDGKGLHLPKVGR